MISALLLTGTSVTSSDSSFAAFAVDIRTNDFALMVADSISFECTHEHWLRMLAISKRCGFNPAWRRASWNIGSCVSGVHEATTTLFKSNSLTCSIMWAIVS